MSRVARPGVRIAVGLAASLLCAAVGVVLTTSETEFRERAKRALGVVVRNATPPRTAAVARTHYPIVRFRDEQGQMHQVRCRDCYTVAGNPVYAGGEKVAVLYDPANPTDARIDSTFSRFGLPVLFGVAAVLALVFLVLLPFRRLRAAT